MKIRFYLIFMLLINVSISAEYKFGRIDPTGYRAYIYSETFTDDIILTPKQNLKKDLPEVEYFNLLYKPTPLINLEIERKNNRFKELLEFNLNNNSNLELKLINIYSTNMELEPEILPDELIHHGLFFKREGLFTTGLLFINSFSRIEKRGYKLVLFNCLKLNKIRLLSIMEDRESYITPLNSEQSIGSRSKFITDFYITDLLTSTYINNLDYSSNDDLWTRENVLEFNFKKPNFNLSLNGGITDKINREYKYGIDIKNCYSLFKNEIDFNIRYININLYYFSDTLTITPINYLDLSLEYNFELEEIVKQELVFKTIFDTSKFYFVLKYIKEIDDIDSSWSINASIYNTDY